MKSRKVVIDFCKGLEDVYEDYPFSDKNWTVIRHKENKKIFAWIFERNGYIWVNVKCSLDERDFFRKVYKSVVPAFHLNKEHWNSIILDGTVPDVDIKRMIVKSYELTKKYKKTK
ncbi:MAG: MmcQ/YjbR family DNA-binding protein [Clostridium sp.]|nr:MmcQ/YjbR family DNA-binding protein [Clostridium sp.]MDY3828019.1 MmcQ/YjbR family DNA-binding protein [Clostridium sp.]